MLAHADTQTPVSANDVSAVFAVFAGSTSTAPYRLVFVRCRPFPHSSRLVGLILASASISLHRLTGWNVRVGTGSCNATLLSCRWDRARPLITGRESENVDVGVRGVTKGQEKRLQRLHVKLQRFRKLDNVVAVTAVTTTTLVRACLPCKRRNSTPYNIRRKASVRLGVAGLFFSRSFPCFARFFTQQASATPRDLRHAIRREGAT